MRPNPVRVIVPGGKPTAPGKDDLGGPSLESAEKQKERMLAFLRNKGVTSGVMTKELYREYLESRTREVREEQEKGPKPAAPGKEGPGAKKEAGKRPPPVTLTAAGNKLIVSSDDPQALALAQDLVRLLTAPQEGGLEVIRLKHAGAAEAAKVLDEAFNGPAGPAPGGRRAGRVRVVPEPITNALIVRASPLDLLTVRRLLSGALDVASDRAEAGPRTYVLPPLRHAGAADLAKVLRELYQGGGKATFTVAVEARTNTLILRASPAVYEDVKKLVERLDVKTD
jgi:hypothetical protein